MGTDFACDSRACRAIWGGHDVAGSLSGRNAIGEARLNTSRRGIRCVRRRGLRSQKKYPIDDVTFQASAPLILGIFNPIIGGSSTCDAAEFIDLALRANHKAVQFACDPCLEPLSD